jgi:hypothetical protein
MISRTASTTRGVDDVINRLNYGFIAHSPKSVCIVDGYWEHVIHIRWNPIRPPAKDKSNLTERLARRLPSNYTNSLIQLVPVFFSLDTLSDSFETSVRSWHQLIESLIPDIGVTTDTTAFNTRRSRRGWINAVGQASSYLFGTATDTEVQELRDLVRNSTTLFELAAADARRTREGMSSFVVLQNQRLTLLNRELDRDRLTMTTLARDVLDDRDSIIDISKLVAKAFTVIAHFTRLHDALEQAEMGIEDLVRGRLSPKLIHIDQMESILSVASDALAPDYRLCTPRPRDAYMISNYEFARSGNDLVVRLRLPYSRDEYHKVYQVTTADMVIPGNRDAVSLLVSTPSSFLVDPGMKVVGAVTQSSYDRYLLRSVVQWAPTQELTCIQALMKQKAEEISLACDFSVIQRTAKPLHQAITKDSFLMNGYSPLTLICSNFTRDVPDCTPCLVKLTCGCSLRLHAKPLLWAPSVCRPFNAHDIVLYPVNRAVLNAFYDDFNETMADLLAPDPRILPPFNLSFFSDQTSRLSASDDEISFSLNKLAASLQNESVILHTPAEALIYDLMHVSSDPSFWSIDLSLKTVIIFVLLFACVVNAVMLARLRAQFAVLILASSTRSAHALYLRTPAPITTTPVLSSRIFTNIFADIQTIDIYLSVFVIMTSVTFLLVFVLLYRLTKRKSVLWLAFYLPSVTIELPLLTLPSPTRDFALSILGEIKMHVSYCFLFGILHIDNSACYMRNILSNRRILLPKHVFLGPRVAWQLRKAPIDCTIRPIVMHSCEYEIIQFDQFRIHNSRNTVV